MRIGLIADIHGNLPALETVLSELKRERVDKLVCLGDVAVGPQPAATVERVADLGCPVVLGNWDAYFLNGFPPTEDELGRKLMEMGAWWAAQLTRDQRAFLQSFRPTYELSLDDCVSVLCFHASPRSYDDWIVATTPDDELERMLDGARAPVLAGGHTHLPLVRRHRESVLVNPGSVGLPFRQQPGPIRICPWAEYAVVSTDDYRLTIELRRTSYDVAAYLDHARATGMPHADWWISCWTNA
jgi:predicted phosphodiesterase